MNPSQCGNTAQQTGAFTLGMALVTLGLAISSMQHQHRALLWVGMALMLVGGMLPGVRALTRRGAPGVREVAR